MPPHSGAVSVKSQIRPLLAIAIPVALSQAGHILVGIADSVMVGRIGSPDGEEGKIALAAASLANSVYSVVMVFGLGITYAITPAVANAQGAGHTQKLPLIFNNAMTMSLITGLLLFILLAILSPLLGLLGQPPQVAELAIPYFNIMLLSMVPLMFFMGLKQFAEGLSLTLSATIVSLGANLLNVFLNYIFIYGKWGFPALGLTGAGWASLISRVVMALLLLFLLYHHKAFIDIRKHWRTVPLKLNSILTFFITGIPIGFQFTFEVGAFAMAAIMMGWISAGALAAHQIAISIAAFTYMIASGIGSAATVRVGQQLGAKKIVLLTRSVVAAFIIVLLFMGGAGALMVIFRDMLPPLFNHDNNVHRITASILIVAALFQLSDGLQVVAQGVLRGLHDIRTPTLISFVAYTLFGLPVAYLLGFIFEFGATGIWSGLLIGLTLSAALQIIRYRYIITKYHGN